MNATAERTRAMPSRPLSASVRSTGARSVGGVRAGERRAASSRAAAAHLAAADAAGRVPPARWTIGALGLALVIALAVALSRFANDPVRFPVTNVDVLGTLDYTDRDTLRARIADELRRGFHGLDVDVVRREVEALPWVAGARVGRVWPGRLSIEIEEHEPAARWNDDALLSKRLVPFRPPQLAGDDVRQAEWREVFAELPRLAGADGREADVLADQRRYAAELAAFDVAVIALEEDPRRSQTLELSNGVTVRLGYEDRESRLARFVDVYERLVVPLDGRAARFDMRYSNGFAVRGADGSALGSVPAGKNTRRRADASPVADDATTREPG